MSSSPDDMQPDGMQPQPRKRRKAAICQADIKNEAEAGTEKEAEKGGGGRAAWGVAHHTYFGYHIYNILKAEQARCS